MIKRLEQVAALVVAAGLAIVSYWLFFSWAQGGGGGEGRDGRRSESRSLLERRPGSDRRASTLPGVAALGRVVPESRSWS